MDPLQYITLGGQWGFPPHTLMSNIKSVTKKDNPIEQNQVLDILSLIVKMFNFKVINTKVQMSIKIESRYHSKNKLQGTVLQLLVQSRRVKSLSMWTVLTKWTNSDYIINLTSTQLHLLSIKNSMKVDIALSM